MKFCHFCQKYNCLYKTGTVVKTIGVDYAEYKCNNCSMCNYELIPRTASMIMAMAHQCNICRTWYADPKKAAECEIMCNTYNPNDPGNYPDPNVIPNQVTMGACECGSEICGSSQHSQWCPKYEK